MNRAAAFAIGSLVLAPLACGGGDATDDSPRAAAHRPPGTGQGGEKPRVPPIPLIPCPSGASNCRSASGRIVYLEAVDPDGDGDAHFVLLSDQGITAPGLSVIDVERELRPHPLPGIGDLVSAAGPVYRGSYGQRQIQAEELRVARR